MAWKWPWLARESNISLQAHAYVQVELISLNTGMFTTNKRKRLVAPVEDFPCLKKNGEKTKSEFYNNYQITQMI